MFPSSTLFGRARPRPTGTKPKPAPAKTAKPNKQRVSTKPKKEPKGKLKDIEELLEELKQPSPHEVSLRPVQTRYSTPPLAVERQATSIKTLTTPHIIQLYRDLLHGRKYLKYTDPKFYTKRIKGEFHENKSITDKEKIWRLYELGIKFIEKDYGGVL